MSIIAVASEGGNVAEHFGHCEAFLLFEIDNGKILKKEKIPNPEHKPGFLPSFLQEKGVATIIAGGMGQGAAQLFGEKHIEVFTGATGNAAEAALACAEGKLTSTKDLCNRHAHRGQCGH